MQLSSGWAGCEFYYEEETDSTNLWLKRLAREGAPHGAVAMAERQTAGRGRRGNQWETLPGTAIAMSILLRPSFAPVHAPKLTLVMGLSVAQTLREEGVKAWIKWPNDVVINKKKLCGILTEMSVKTPEAIDYVIIGTGLNVNVEEFPPEVSSVATSLKLETGKDWDRMELLKKILYTFSENYEKFSETEDLSLLRDAYSGLLINRQKKVRILEDGGNWEGIARGINQEGELMVEKEDGSLTAVSAGEVSVRGLYGYI